MKQKLLSALVVAAVAGMAANANAGVIQASYKNYAAEVFGDPTVLLTAPTINYALALPLSGTANNPNQFTITWTLGGGAKFNAAPAATAITLATPSNTNGLNPVTVSLDATGTVLTANFTINNGVNYTVGSQIALGVNTAGVGVPVTLTNVSAVLGAGFNNCSPVTQSLPVTVKLTNAAGVEFDSNFTQAPLLNTTPIAQAAPAISIQAVSSSAYDALVAANNELSQVNVLTGSLGKLFTNPADISASTSFIELGRIVFSDRATLYGLAGANAYSVKNTTGAANSTGWLGGVAAVAVNDGAIAQNGVTFTVSGKFATSVNGTAGPLSLVVVDAATNTVIPSTTTYNTGNTIATVKITGANLDPLTVAGGVRTLAIRYPVDNTTIIPTSQFAIASGALAKQTASLQLADSVCPGNLYNLTANGVQIDVRNYVPNIVTDQYQWKSVVRIINTDPSQNATVIGTVLHRDGTLGASAPLVTLKPQELVYMQSKDIDTILNAAATASATSFVADDVAANARLRLTSNSSSIRVQNYLFNPANGNFFEASSAQGDEGPDYALQRNVTNK